MIPKKLSILAALFIATALVLAACGGGGGTPKVSDTEAPAIIANSPAGAGVEVYPHLTTLSVSFSEEMDCASVDETTFTLTDGTTPVTGTVTAQARTRHSPLAETLHLIPRIRQP